MLLRPMIISFALACSPVETPFEAIVEQREPTFPGPEWETASPEEVGLDGDVVDELLDKVFEHEVVQGVVITRHGYVVGERYSVDASWESPATSWSVAKSFYASAMVAAVDEGLVGSVDDHVSDYLSEWVDTDKSSMTIRNVLEMRTGLFNSDELFQTDLNEYALELELSEPIDSAFDYNNFNSQIFGEVIQRVSQQSATEFLSERLLDPIGFQASRFWRDPSENSLCFAGVDASTREFARFGHLIASNGSWDGQALLSSEGLEAMTRPGSDSFYAQHWWTTTPALALLLAYLGGDEIPQVTSSLELPVALGANGQFIIPWAEEGIVVAINTNYVRLSADNNVFTITNFPITNPAGDALYRDLFEYLAIMERLPKESE